MRRYEPRFLLRRAETIMSILDAQADVNRRQESASCSWLVSSLYWSANVALACGSKDSRLEYLNGLQGATAFQLARQTFNEEILRTLIEARADTRSLPPDKIAFINTWRIKTSGSYRPLTTMRILTLKAMTNGRKRRT